MNGRLQSHIFWGKYAPLSTLTGAFFLVVASTRFALAIFCAGALLWDYGFTALIFYSGRRYMPKKGRFIILLFLSSLVLSIYILIMSFLNPLLLAGAWFILVLIPPSCAGSGLFNVPGIPAEVPGPDRSPAGQKGQAMRGSSLDAQDTAELIPRVWQEAACLALLVIAISLIREPLGMGTLSFPGGAWGIMELLRFGEDGEGFFPVKLLSVSAGGLLLLGFGVAVFRYVRTQQSLEEDDQ